MNVTYFEDSDSLVVSFEMDPEQKVGRAYNYMTNEQTIISLDEAGNILSVEVMDYAKRLYGADPVTVIGLPALLETFPVEGSTPRERYEEVKAEVIAWGERTWRGGFYRRKEDDR